MGNSQSFIGGTCTDMKSNGWSTGKIECDHISTELISLSELKVLCKTCNATHIFNLKYVHQPTKLCRCGQLIVYLFEPNTYSRYKKWASCQICHDNNEYITTKYVSCDQCECNGYRNHEHGRSTYCNRCKGTGYLLQHDKQPCPLVGKHVSERLWVGVSDEQLNSFIPSSNMFLTLILYMKMI